MSSHIAKTNPDETKESLIYVLVFPNLFSKDSELRDTLKAVFSKSKCIEIFNSAFKISEDDNTDSRNWLNEELSSFLRDSPEEVEFKSFLMQIMICLFKLMQEKLKLTLKLFYSRDKDEIFCKI